MESELTLSLSALYAKISTTNLSTSFLPSSRQTLLADFPIDDEVNFLGNLVELIFQALNFKSIAT